MVEKMGDSEDMNKCAMKSQERTSSGKKINHETDDNRDKWKTGRKYPMYIVIYV